MGRVPVLVASLLEAGVDVVVVLADDLAAVSVVSVLAAGVVDLALGVAAATDTDAGAN